VLVVVYIINAGAEADWHTQARTRNSRSQLGSDNNHSSVDGEHHSLQQIYKREKTSDFTSTADKIFYRRLRWKQADIDVIHAGHGTGQS